MKTARARLKPLPCDDHINDTYEPVLAGGEPFHLQIRFAGWVFYSWKKKLGSNVPRGLTTKPLNGLS